MSQANLLRLSTAALLVAVAGLAQTATAAVVSNNSAAFTVDFPIDPANTERVGPRTTIQFDLAAGLQAAGVITDGAGLTAALIGLDASGNAVTGAIADVTAGLTVANYSNGAGNANLVLNLAGTTTAAVFGNPSVVNVALRVSTANNNINTDGVQTVFNAGDETLDDCFIADSTAPTLSNVFISQDGNTLFFVFSESMNTGAAANDNNHTVLANITAADFQVSATSAFVGSAGGTPSPDPTGLTFAGTFTAGSGNSVIQVARNSAGTNTTSGSFIRLKATDDAGVTANHDAFDRVANRASQAAVTISSVTSLAVSSAEIISPTSIRVIFNNPLQGAGATGAYALINAGTNLVTSGAIASIDTATIDPNNNRAVLLTFTAGTDTISSDGLLTSSNGNSTGAISVRVINDGAAVVEPQDIFGSFFGGTTATQTDVAAADKIAPSLVGGGPAFLDTNGDGTLDAAALIFDEPIADTTATTGFELAVLTGVSTRPAYLIDVATGVLATNPLPATVESGTQANRNIPISSVARGSVAPTNGVAQNTRTTNNAVILAFNASTFDWDNDGTTRSSATPDANEPVPGNADGGAVNLIYNATTATIVSGRTNANISSGNVADLNGNRFANGGAAVNGALTVDRAAPAFLGATFFTGDNQGGGSNAQNIEEQDGTVGDGNTNNRIALIFSEAMGESNTANITEELLSFGAGGNTFNPNDFLFRSSGIATVNNIANNIYTVGTVSGTTQANATLIRPGVSLTLVAPGTGDGGFSDAANNQSTFSARTATDGVAPYIALTTDVNQTTQSGAFAVDADSDGFIDAIRVKFTQRIDSASLRQADFTVSGGGTVSGAPTVDSTDNSVVVIPVTDNILSINNAVTLTYSGAVTGASLVRAQASPNGNGLAVNAITENITIRGLQQPIADTREIGTMVVTGNITNGTTPVPVGTKVFMMNAVPTALNVTAVHNNTEFTVGRFGSYNDSGSIDAWTNWILQLEKDIYLHTNDVNRQVYRNCKIISSTGNPEANITLSRQVIRLTPNANNLGAITFTGSGQSASERVSSGRVNLCWDVLRSSDGTLDSLYNTNCGSGGYEFDGLPILSRAVVTDNTGNYVIHHSGPTGGFNGRTRLDATNRPVIVVVEFPDGRRFVASSLLTSVNGRPLLFRTNLGNTNTNGSAQGGVRFDINLANIAGGVPTDTTSQTIWSEWNIVSYARDGGFASAAGNLPLLPNGVTATSSSSTRIVTGTTLSAVNALNQFVLWTDGFGVGTRGDGMWTSNDDNNGPFDGVIVDYKCFNAFAFAMTSRGVQLDSGITGFTGGYAFGIFNASGNSYGVFQFGPRFGTGVTSIFGTGSAAFPTNGSTRGWVLAAAAASAANGGAFLTANADSDYAIRFNNKGPNASFGNQLEIDVTSQSSTANGTGTPANANNLGAVPDEAGLFVHFDR